MIDWLQSLKCGDRVIVVGRHGDGRSVRRVSRTTASRVMVNVGGTSDMAFRRLNGREVGSTPYGGMQLEEGTHEAIEAVCLKNRRTKLAYELNHRNWENVPLEKLEQITTILSL